MKLAKLSLAAIMTVGALSTANAQPLEDAIKGVDFSGYMKFNSMTKLDVGTTGTDGAAAQDWDYGFTFVAPVADNLTATIGFGTDSGSAGDDTNGRASVNDQSFAIKSGFFTYAKDALTVKTGHQTIPTPFSDNDGLGAVGMYNMGKVTLASLYFLNTDYDAGQDLAGVAAIGSFGMVNAQLWAAKMPGVLKSQVFFQVDGKVAGLGLTGQAIQTKLDATGADTKGTAYRLKAAYSMDNFGVSVAYAKNDDKQQTHALAGDDDTGVIGIGWRIQNEYKTANTKMAETAYDINVNAAFGKFGVAAGYAVAKNYTTVAVNEQDMKEYYASVKYAYAKNFYGLVKAGSVNDDNDALDQKLFYFEAKYSF